MCHCFQIFTECRTYLGLPVCRIWSPGQREYSPNFCNAFFGFPWHSEHFSIFYPPPPVNRRTETLKTLPSHHTSYVRGNNVFSMYYAFYILQICQIWQMELRKTSNGWKSRLSKSAQLQDVEEILTRSDKFSFDWTSVRDFETKV